MDDTKGKIKKSSVDSSINNRSGGLKTPLLSDIETERKHKYCEITHEEEQDDLDILYNYIRYDLLGYKIGQPLPSVAVMRLKGMAQGTTMGSKRDDVGLIYSYKIILLAFIKKTPIIQYSLRTKKFKTEADKILYICKISESILNDILLLDQKKKWQEDQLHIQEEDSQEENNCSSVRSEELLSKNDNNQRNIDGKFNDLW